MARSSAVRALAPLAMLAVVGCQDYNFNPVGHCLVQPGNERVTLSDLSSADILFVVDDSGSMGAEQAKLAANFSAFINNLDASNANRVASGLSPIDFHIAVTTTSVYWNANFASSFAYTCQAGVCRNSAGEALLDTGNQPVTCDRVGSVLPDQANTSGVAGCGSTFDRSYDFTGCAQANGVPIAEVPPAVAGVAAHLAAYPRGDFVSWNGNPRVLHFDKELYGPTGRNRQGFTREQLINFFVGSGTNGGNIVVGTCGSGEEQALQAARLALQKALDGKQKDTYTIAGQPAWDATTRTASATAEWPRPNSKLVIAFVGDEDDCSSPDDASAGIVMRADDTGADACVRDWQSTDPARKKQFPVGELVDYLAGLGRQLGAAFIFPAEQTSCSGTSCTPGLCCQENCPTAGVCTQSINPANYCGAQAPGHRLYDAANQLRNRGADVIAGSVCDGDFATLLNELAEIVKPPAGLTLPTQPAEGQITLLRIAARNGQTRKTCNGPAPAGTTLDAARASYDWWFTAGREVSAPVEVSQNVYINQGTGNCVADAGETYSADYIALNPPSGCTTRDDCQRVLGGRPENWGCYTPPGTGRGTCVCCEAGSTAPECQP
ncbi:vWA domain-containing protein [Anaeromyxobacter sp. Fw109-5]|uniref:vWA domain-containing protein n=1 Tax=Anaeromyxobacter sp. (strain Fw109-5) TaxID=404589 RepID=UPI0000ED7D45|nr:vWA domain-containing protein [Anaeromyxobacter sp. Fw109-5]ABS25732.1 conserved hypothetical protein [Anaeromyxobacter sp. Fw109-5]